MKKLFLNSVVLLSCLSSALAQDASRILGQWINEDLTQVVEVKKVDKFYQARIIHLNVENGDLLLDSENDEKDLRTRKVVGASVWINFEYLADKDMWKNGRIYNYKTGNYYSGKIRVEGDELKLTGYYGFFFFLAKTQKWTKAVQ